jgi:predicted kinase
MNNEPFHPTLVIFSGLPGTGKSTLADRLARELRWPLLRIDDVVLDVPENAGPAFWDEKVLVLLTLAEAQLALGLSVLLDSVFMGGDRLHAQELARTYQAAFRPVYCFVSDEFLWRQRVTHRAEMLQNPAVATWERIAHQREHFDKWEQDTALFVDGVLSIEQNYVAVRKYATGQNPYLIPLPVPIAGLKKGNYHA